MTIVKYDQHFMIDKKIIKKIIDSAGLDKDEVVLEIGPGKGVLTKKLCKKAKEVICVEIDPENEESLKDLKLDNCNIIIGNALNYIDTISFDKIISNLPYCLSEPLFKKLTKIDFKLCVFTIGKHFYDVISDENKKLHYLAKSFFDVEYICDVPKSAFEPEPDVDSCVLCINIKKNRSLFDDCMCVFFKQEDKLLRNALMNVFWNKLEMTKKESKNAVKEIGLSQKDLNMNMDLISNDEFLKIVAALKKVTKTISLEKN